MQGPPPEACEPTRYQSRKKHAVIDFYLRVWPENVAPKARRNGKQPVSLAVVDLFASHGWCHDKESGHTWEGSGVLAARHWQAYSTSQPKQLVLNSYHPDVGVQSEQLANLIAAVKAEGVDITRPRVTFLTLTATEAVAEAKKHLRPEFPSVWILDPYKPADLPWAVVESIVSWTGEYEDPTTGKTVTRRPEVFITLMTWALQRGLKLDGNWPAHAIREVSDAVGLPEAEWRPIFDNHYQVAGNVREALIELYKDRLEAAYGRRPFHELVESADGNIIYALFFCSKHQAGFFSFAKIAMPAHETWKKEVDEPIKMAIREKRLEKRADARADERIAEVRKKNKTLF
jgi:three-Cys-motif partner protein